MCSSLIAHSSYRMAHLHAGSSICCTLALHTRTPLPTRHYRSTEFLQGWQTGQIWFAQTE
eukprot:413268-Rhodomonas_salina.2